jgi:hypothetical protein
LLDIVFLQSAAGYGGNVKIIHSVAASALVAQLVLHGAATSGAEITPWTDTAKRLAVVRDQAVKCIAQLKKYGDYTQKRDGERTYDSAKTSSDAVIEGLITALSMGEKPGGRPDLQEKLESSVLALDEFCEFVRRLIPDTGGQKGPVVVITKIIPSELKKLLDGIVTLSSYYSHDNALERAEIRTDLGTAKWPTFSEVKEAP